jgi:hypothetical protein
MALKYLITGLPEEHGGLSWPDLPVLCNIDGDNYVFVRGSRIANAESVMLFATAADAADVCAKLTAKRQIIEVETGENSNGEIVGCSLTATEPIRPPSKARR